MATGGRSVAEQPTMELYYLHYGHLTSHCDRNSAARCIMSFHLTTGPIVSLIAGILILVIPRLLNYIVAIYLILIGLLGLGVFGVV
jgi:hypothetical protein